MAKHKLFTARESSPQFNSSIEEGSSSGSDVECNVSEMPMKPGPSKGRGTVEEGPNSVREVHHSSSQDSGSEWESVDIQNFFSQGYQKLPYSFEEDEEILKFVLKGESIFRVGSISLWRELEYKKGNPKRTYQSLKNRFLRNIQPRLFTTYRHLLTDKEVVRKILDKFPHLRKHVGNREVLSEVTLPERPPERRPPVRPPCGGGAPAVATGACRDRRVGGGGGGAQANGVRDGGAQRPGPTDAEEEAEDSEANVGAEEPLNFHRLVKIVGCTIRVTVNLKFKEPPPRLVGVYTRFLELRARNDSVPCPKCGRGGVPPSEGSLTSDAESDDFISTSLESKRSGRVCRRKRSVGSRKRRRSDADAEPCSQSLLNDVSETGELDEMVEVDDDDTDSVSESAMGDFRQLIDSDEEEMLIKKSLRRSLKKLGFEGLSMDAGNVDSFFFSSSGAENASLTESSQAESETGATPSLVQNMMNMMKTQKE